MERLCVFGFLGFVACGGDDARSAASDASVGVDGTLVDAGANDGPVLSDAATRDASADAREASVAFPAAEFVFGFDQVAGVPPGIPGGAWPFTDDELTEIRDAFGMNAIRIFVHPAFVGLPQQTWTGPEPIRYSSFAPSAYVFDRPGGAIDSLDEMIQKLLDFGLFPILQPFVVDEYLNYVYKSDLTFLDDGGADSGYTGINPKDEVKAFSLAVVSHVQQRFNTPFGVVWAEICGSGAEGTLLRTGEKAAWTEIASAMKASAPSMELFGPEICTSLAWFSTSRANGCGTYDPVYYGTDWPRWDRLDNYASVFGELAVSFYGISQSDVTQFCPQSTQLRATTDTDIAIVRDHINGAKWLYSEVGWGAPTPDGSVPAASEDDVHLNWASFLMGSDRSRGILIWQAKDAPPTLAGIWASDGAAKPTHDDLQMLAKVVRDNRAFLSVEHSLINGDGLPTDTTDFSETDPAIMTRKLAAHVVVFSNGPTQVQLSQTGGHGLVLAYGAGSTPTVSNSTDTVLISGLVPKRLYVFAIQ
jgi:hypothetical protein